MARLEIGNRLGPYRVVDHLGAGGMGDVYRARDTRLERDVAIKILKGHFTERFEREARAISALNHPHICSLYDVGSEDATNYLVMELIEGAPLQGPLKIADAVRYGIEIAGALAAAHAKGIVHRDLKPANILITKSGVKLLDFGLAKTAAVAAGAGATITRAITGEGQLVGTLQYMAPEQMDGKEADARSDIFAFGCVLYEALTGRPAFAGATPASVIAAIMTAEPRPLAEAQPLAPASLERVVRTCLAKDPEERFQTARDLKRALEWSLAEAPAQTPSRPRLLPWIVTAFAIAALLLVLLLRKPMTPPAAASVRFRFSEPEGTWLQRYITRQSFALSPVGGQVAMVAHGPRGSMIWVRRFDKSKAVALAGTEGAEMVFWSPDARHIGFYSKGKLRKIPAAGGAVLPICEIPGPVTATWSPQGTIVAGLRDSSLQVNIETGAVSKWKTVFWPQFLPDGKRILYLERKPGQPMRAYMQDWPNGTPTGLMDVQSRVSWAPGSSPHGAGYLLSVRDATLFARPFDPDRPGAHTELVAVAEDVPFFQPSYWAEFDVSRDGHLVFASGIGQAQLSWLDRSGREIGTIGEVRDYWGGARLDLVSPRIFADVYDLRNGGSDVWAVDTRTGAAERLTFDPGVEAAPVPSPDGSRIAYGSAQGRPPQLRVMRLGQRGPADEYPAAPFQIPRHWTSDGRWIVYQTAGGALPAEIWFASALEDRSLYPVVQVPGLDASNPATSPDGKLLAYASAETGRSEVYVQAFESGPPPRVAGSKRRVSLEGGTAPLWRRDGRELFFLSLSGLMMAVAIDLRMDWAAPVALFKVPASANGMNPMGGTYDIDAGGKRFMIVNRRRSAEPLLEAILNWQAGLRQ